MRQILQAANCELTMRGVDSAMTIRLPEKWTRFLVRQLESGMGYQRVDVRLANNRKIKDVVVFNAEEIELPDDCGQCEIEEMRIHDS